MFNFMKNLFCAKPKQRYRPNTFYPNSIPESELAAKLTNKQIQEWQKDRSKPVVVDGKEYFFKGRD
jgi:hypothetical protein